MIALTRLPKPAILERRGPDWTRKFLDKRASDPKARPRSEQYAHPDVLAALVAMSHSKCFYCESLLDENEYEVDHFVEISVDESRAFEWTNLYLACRACNGGKLPERSVPREDCVDPCAPDADPASHLTFENDCIRPVQGSHCGRQTIAKYKLNRGDLQIRRARQLIRFKDELDDIRKSQIREGGRGLSATERERLDRYRQPEHAYSAMFVCLMERALAE